MTRYTLTVILLLVLLGVLAATVHAQGIDIVCDSEKCVLSRRAAEALVNLIEQQQALIEELQKRVGVCI